jgi:predicted kinase
MSDEHDHKMTTITLELPVELCARLDELQRQFGDELIADLLFQADARVRSKLALRGAHFDKDGQ